MNTLSRIAARTSGCEPDVIAPLISILFFAALLLVMPQAAWAQTTYTVCALPAACDYVSPEAAVNDPVVIDGDTIDIMTDTYVLGATLLVDNSITILANNSIFDANGLRAIDVSNAATNLSLTNVTIRNGQAGAGFGGGALRVSDGAVVTVFNGIFENNQADFGGAVHNIGSTVNLRESVFTGNRATAGDGGAVLTDSGGVTDLTRTRIDANQASVAGGGVAVVDAGSNLGLTESTVSNNVALNPVQTVSNSVISGTTIACGGGGLTGQTFIADGLALSAFEINIRLNGGGTSVIPSDLNIAGLVRQGGPAGPVIATAIAFAPGGVWPGGSTQTLTYVLDQPVALIPGDTYAMETSIAGAYSIFISSLSVDEYVDGGQFCGGTFNPNWDYYFRTFGGTPGEGSGVFASAAGAASLLNSTVSGNVGEGVLADTGGLVDSQFSTIANNSLDGLIALAGAPAGQVSLSASIIANNGGFDCSGNNFVSNGFNLIGDASNCVIPPSTGDLIGTGGAPIDPLLGPLQNNGGSTSTHAIDQTSLAVDGAGSGLLCSTTPVDQRGVARPNGTACDIGAYELAPPVGPLQTLIDAAAPGATVIIPDGVYTESITLGDGKTLRGSGLTNVVFDASGTGASAIIASGDFGLEGLSVIGGNSPGHGGGIFATIAGTDIVLLNVLLDNNNAALDGGAIYLLNGTLSASYTIFNNNGAGGNGGAIAAGTATTVNISSVLLENNTTVTAGGAVFSDGNLSISDTTISANDAAVGGGIYTGGTGIFNVVSSTFSDNTANISAATAGGAIAGAGTIDIRNSTLSGNLAINGNGGGIGLSSGTARLNNVTLAFNAAPAGLGGSFYADFGALISLSNTLLSNNTGGATNCSSVKSLGYNLFQSTPCPALATDITAAPLIGLLASNGGLTATHALQPLSPAINAGQPVPNFPQFDAGNLSLLQVQGYTNLDAGTLLLADETSSVGSAFVTNPIDPSQSFSAKFGFQITPNPTSGHASDGITFTISDDPTVLGQGGGVLGIAVYDTVNPPGAIGVVNGVSVEFDTWVNGSAAGANDPGSVDHIGIDINGNLSSQALTVLGPHGTLSDGSIWTAWIDYDAGTNILEVRATNNGIRPAAPTVSTGVDILALTGPNAFVGFTGATGTSGLSGRHRIVSFSFTNSCEPLDQRGSPRPNGAICDIGAFENDVIPASLGPVTLSTVSPGQGLDNGFSYPGVVDIPLIDIPIEKLTGDTFNAPESAPLGSFPLGSFPIGSFDLQSSPIGSFPLGSFPIGSFPIGSFPLGSFPLSSLPVSSAGGWAEVLKDIPELAGAPVQTVTLEQVLTLNPLPPAVADIELRDLSIQGSPLASLSLPGLSLGDTTVAELDQWAQNADPGGGATICATLRAADPNFADCGASDTLMGLEVKGAPVSALTLSSLPLGSFPIGSFPIGSFPIGSFPLGSFPIGSFPLGSFPIGSFPIGSFPLGSFPLGSFPLSSFNLLAAPLDSLPLGSFPIGSFPLGSFAIDGKPFCEFYDEQVGASGARTCAQLGVNPGTDSLADLVAKLQLDDPAGNIASTPLGSFPMGSFPIGSFPIGSFSLDTLNSPPLSLLTLGDFNGCQEIDGTADCTSIASLSTASSLVDVATEFGTLAASPLGSFPLGSFGIASLPMGSFPIGSFEINGTPLGSFPLGSFDLISSPLGSFPLASFASLSSVLAGPCTDCQSLADAAQAGVLKTTATLADLASSSAFAATTLGQVLDAMTLAILYGPGTLADIENTGNLTLGQLLIAMMLKTEFPWETIALEQLDAQEFSADNFVDYQLAIPLNGNEVAAVGVTVNIATSFLYKQGSAALAVTTALATLPTAPQADPVIVDNGDGTQTLSFNLTLGGSGFTDNTLSFTVVPAMALGSYPATAEVVLNTDPPVPADNSSGMVSVIPALFTDISDSSLALTAPVDVLLLGFIDTPDDNDFYRVAPPAAGDRVAVFMSNPAGDNDLIMYEPLSTVEKKGQTVESAALDSIPFEDDGIDYQGNLTEEPNALEDVNLANQPLASISTNRGNSDESVSAIAGDTAPFTIQVSGYNGAISKQPYTLRVKVTPQVPNPQCSARNWPVVANATVLPAGNWMADTNAVFLVNWERLAASDPDGAPGADAALTAINNLIHAPGVTNGVVVDVSGIFGVNNAYATWDANPCDVDAANAIVNAVTKYLEEQRVVSPHLSYVTIVGSDEVIPFARKPDETSISNESTFAGEFSDNALYGVFITRHFLSDDSFGDIDPIPWLDRYLNVPELGVGRLVESAADIQLAVANYIAFGGVLNPQTAFSAGYDFVADAAQDIDDTFNTHGLVLGFNVEAALIDPAGVAAANAWTALDFFNSTALGTANPVDLVSFNMHFDFDEALPSSGNAAGNYADNLINAADLLGADLNGGIWFTVGCHTGTNVPDVAVIGGAPSQDWAQSFGSTGALFLAQTGFGLGDTEAIALSERLMAIFARNLDGSMTIGQAHAFAKQRYFADLGLYGEYDYKVLQEATLFGLPMYRYGSGVVVSNPQAPALPVANDPLSGLASALWSLADTGITQTPNTSKGDLFSVDGEVQFIHFRPLQPIVRRDVTGPNGEIASGAFLTGLITEDKWVADIAFARPVIDLGDIEPEIETDEVVFPTAFTNIASFKAPSPGGGPFAPRQQLNVIVGQFTSPLDGASSGTERLFRSFDTQVFYRPAPSVQAAQVAVGPVTEDFVRPEFDNVQASVVGSGAAKQAAFSVDVTDAGTVLRVAVLYLESVSGLPERGNWVLVDLVKGSGNTWTGGGPVDLSGIANGQIDYMVQAVDSNGNVANSTFKGLFYVAEEIPTAPDPGAVPGAIGVVVTVDGNVVNPGDWITTDPVDIEITGQNPQASYEYSVDFKPFVPLTSAGFQITDDGVHIVTVRQSDGSNPVTFVILIDTTPPQIVITTPATGEFVVQGQAPAAKFNCLDAGSGLASCVGTVSDGAPVPSPATGSHAFVVAAQDDAQLGPVVAETTYFVVQPLEVAGPTDPTLISDPVTVAISATDLTGFTEIVTIDWGDGGPLETVDLSVTSLSALSIEHIYPAADRYQLTVTVDYDGQFTQVGTIDSVLVYDPQGGRVSGEGWIDSPAGAYTPNDSSDPEVVGKFKFDFELEYEEAKAKGDDDDDDSDNDDNSDDDDDDGGSRDKDEKEQWRPDGKSKFHFRAGGLKLEAVSFDWMIVNAATVRFRGEARAKKGDTTLYTFQVTALDADISGSGSSQDQFRVRIWQEDTSGAEIVLYDNGPGISGSGTSLGDGSIKIRAAKD